MEYDSKDIIHCVFVDKREVAMKSPCMEMEAFQHGIREMRPVGVLLPVPQISREFRLHIKEKVESHTYTRDSLLQRLHYRELFMFCL